MNNDMIIRNSYLHHIDVRWVKNEDKSCAGRILSRYYATPSLHNLLLD